MEHGKFALVKVQKGNLSYGGVDNIKTVALSVPGCRSARSRSAMLRFVLSTLEEQLASHRFGLGQRRTSVYNQGKIMQ